LPSFGMGGLNNDNQAAQQQAYSESKQIAPLMVFGDYYPLTPYSLAVDAWIAWQFDSPEVGNGCVQAFRRVNATSNSITLRLQGLDAAKTYQVRNFDQPGTQNVSGQDLMTNGLTVQLAPLGSAIFSYQVVTSNQLQAGRSPISNDKARRAVGIGRPASRIPNPPPSSKKARNTGERTTQEGKAVLHYQSNGTSR
jgi:hypothetical protein